MCTKVTAIVIGALETGTNRLGQYLDEIKVTTQIGLIQKSTLMALLGFSEGFSISNKSVVIRISKTEFSMLKNI